MPRAAIVYWGHHSDKLKKIASALSKGIEAQNIQVDVFNGNIDSLRLTGFDYLLLGTCPVDSISKKIEVSIKESFKNCGTIIGKRCFAFVLKKGIRTNGLMQEFMKTLEAEGLMVKNFSIIKSEEEAQEIAKKLHIIKK